MQCDAADSSFEVLMHLVVDAASWVGCAITYEVRAAQALRTSESRRGGSAACLIKPCLHT